MTNLPRTYSSDNSKIRDEQDEKGLCSATGQTINTTTQQVTPAYSCVCQLYYGGAACDVPWYTDVGFMRVVTAYQVFTVVCFGIVLLWSSYELYLVLRFAPHERLSLVTYAFSAITFGCVCRAVITAVDPNRIKLILPNIAYRLLASLPVVVWFSVGLAGDIFWLEKSIRIEGYRPLKVFKYLLLVSTIIFCITIIAVTTAPNTVQTTVAPNRYLPLVRVIYNAVTIVMGLLYCITTIILGVKLQQHVTILRKSAPHLPLRRMMIQIGLIAFFLGAFFVTTVVDMAIGTLYREYYLSIQWTMRVEELGTIICLLSLFSRRSFEEKNSSVPMSPATSQYPPGTTYTSSSSESMSGDTDAFNPE
ncbi:hypothetical protein PROFUN_01855 [Planoprotostelium fungivorum]|uniref:Uncharacterized protein n=1 Tax=Planoprotostelium fungivorum TaxID=1890364 RepID=A0A2P6NYV7_9EUKA|nr:hypothetical protein PROFUN_01855 [Planoprotostelium fungivorum]